ncbi:MAG TPA: hypothetical protein VF310_07015, partial [Vicinamibacteria bacterium]
AEYDKREAGGNEDSLITAADEVFRSLRLWDDADHDGVSDAGELFTLRALGVAAVSVDYQVSAATDKHGNEFRYRAPVYGTQGSRVGPFAYDVFLVTDGTGGDSLLTCTTTCTPPIHKCRLRCNVPLRPECGVRDSFGFARTESAACANATVLNPAPGCPAYSYTSCILVNITCDCPPCS